jgi:hypothetical protein
MIGPLFSPVLSPVLVAYFLQAPSPAPVLDAPPATFSGTTTGLFEWRGDNRNGLSGDDHFGDAILRSNLTLDGGDTRVLARFDGEGFVRSATDVLRRDDLRLERFALDLERRDVFGTSGDRLRLQLGDFYAQFGKGLALSLRRLDELGLDVAARGARADLGLGDDRAVLTLLYGLANPVNVELQQLRHVDDPGDAIGGGRAEVRVLDASRAALVLGGHAVMASEGATSPTGERRRTSNVGATLDATLGSASLALEVDEQRRELLAATASGRAVYGSLTLPLGPATILVEGKHYASFQPLTGSRQSIGEGRFLYSLPPTAERIDQELVDNTDITGGRLRSDVALGPQRRSSVHGSAALFHDRALDQWFAHGFAGVDLRRASGLALLFSGGYRREWLRSTGQLSRAIAHGEADALAPLHPRLSLHLIARHESHVEGASRHVFHRGGSSAELSLDERLSFGGGLDWDTQNQRPDVARRFGFGVVRYRPHDALVLAALFGSQRGGLRCLAGACRVSPPFSGARVEVTLRH